MSSKGMTGNVHEEMWFDVSEIHFLDNLVLLKMASVILLLPLLLVSVKYSCSCWQDRILCQLLGVNGIFIFTLLHTSEESCFYTIPNLQI